MRQDDLLPGESLSLRLHGERLRVVLDFGLDVSPLKHFITAASSNNTWLQQPDGTPSLAAASLTSEVLAKNSTKVIRPLLPGRPRVHLPRDCHPSTFAQYSDVDAVLVSSVQGMMALPFLVDMFHQADMHVPRILATEPVKEYARLAMEELVRAIDRCELMPREKRGWFDEVDARAAEILAAGLDTSVVRRWMPMYSMAQVDECMRHVETVAYGQYIRLTDGCTVCARSSGYALGSAHWLLKIQSFTVCQCVAVVR